MVLVRRYEKIINGKKVYVMKHDRSAPETSLSFSKKDMPDSFNNSDKKEEKSFKSVVKKKKIIIPSSIKKDLRGYWEKGIINSKREDYLTLRIYRSNYYSERKDKTFYDVQIFKGRGQKPFANYRFSTESNREDYINRIKENIKSNEEQKIKRRNERKISHKKSNIKVGDLFETSWGYDQTNYDFIKVVRMSPSGKTAYCKQAFKKNLGSELIYNKQTASTKTWGKEFPMVVEGENLRGTYWKKWHDNQESTPFRLATFYPVVKGKEYYETDSRFGH